MINYLFLAKQVGVDPPRVKDLNVIHDFEKMLERRAVTPHSRGVVDYPSTRGIQVDVGVPDATSKNRVESPLYEELYPNKTPA